MRKFHKVFRKLSDPRAANAVHDLLDNLVIALAAVLCGSKGATDMALFGRSKKKLLQQLLPLKHGIPSHDTFSRVFQALDPEAFEQAFRRFTVAFAKANGINLTGVVAIDGKAVRGAYERGKSSTPLHMVNVFVTEARMALASRKAPGRNEAKGALEGGGSGGSWRGALGIAQRQLPAWQSALDQPGRSLGLQDAVLACATGVFGTPGDDNRNCAGTMFSRSLLSSPIWCRSPLQQGQVLASRSTTTSIRGRCAGSAPRLLRRLRARSARPSGAVSSWLASVQAAACWTSSRPSSICSSGSVSAFRPKR